MKKPTISQLQEFLGKYVTVVFEDGHELKGILESCSISYEKGLYKVDDIYRFRCSYIKEVYINE